MRGQHRFTVHIMIGMALGIICGLLIRWIPFSEATRLFLTEGVLNTVGQIFLRLIFLLVVPIVLVSLMCGASHLSSPGQLGRIGGKSLLLYLLTTAIAVILALIVAKIFRVGSGLALSAPVNYSSGKIPAFTEVLINIVPKNPFNSLSNGVMLQIIVFSLLVGIAISAVGKKGEKFLQVLQSANEILLKLIMMIMKVVPYGVFFLLAKLFATMGFTVFDDLLLYFFTVLLVLFIQLFGSYALLLFILAGLNPIPFFKKMYRAMLFAFSVSSSNASIPIVLETVEDRLGVDNSIASFIIPLGSTINMDGTSIMQGVATVLIAHAYGIPIGFSGYIMVIIMAVLASIGTAGVPSVGLITLSLVLNQVGLPVQGVMLIIGVDRLLDMVRTAVNISGDAMISVVVAKSEKKLSMEIYRDQTI